MQHSNEASAEPSMEDILASIRKIISEEPAGAKPNASVPPSATQLAPSQAPGAQYPVTPSPPSNVGASSRLSDIVRELAPAAVPVSSISSASFHDDMADLVEGGASSLLPAIKASDPAFESGKSAAPAYPPVAPVDQVASEKSASRADPAVSAPVMKSVANISAPVRAPQSPSNSASSPQRPSADFGSFIPSTAESIGMTSPRPLPISLGAEFRNVEPQRTPAPPRPARPEPLQGVASDVQKNLDADEAAPEHTHDHASSSHAGDNDPVAAAQSALGALAIGFAAPAQTATSVSTVAPARADVSLRPSDPSPAIETGRKSLDDSIVDMLRPMLRDWLDAHLPEMVERALNEELRDKRDHRS